MPRTLLRALLALVAFLAIGPAALAQDAVAYQINPAHDGHTVFPGGFKPPLKRRWTRDLGDLVSYPVIANGLVFVTVANAIYDKGTHLYALDLATGETVWHKLLGDSYYWSNAAYDNGRLYVINFSGILQAFSADRAGQLLWAVQLPEQWNFENAPIAVDGYIYVHGAGDAGTLYSVDEATGHIRWTTHDASGASGSSPAYGDGGIYLTYLGLYWKVSPFDGHVIWGKTEHWVGGSGATPVVYNHKLYVRDPMNGNAVLDAADGKAISSLNTSTPPAFWRNPKGKNFLITLQGNTLVSSDAKKGQVAWSFTGDGQIDSNAIVINDTVAVGSQSGLIYLLDAATGQQLWSSNVGAPITFNTGAFPWSGLGAGAGYLIVPATNLIAAFSMKDGAQ